MCEGIRWRTYAVALVPRYEARAGRVQQVPFAHASQAGRVRRVPFARNLPRDPTKAVARALTKGSLFLREVTCCLDFFKRKLLRSFKMLIVVCVCFAHSPPLSQLAVGRVRV